ncbi:hypothetical protein ASPWEDRAFT_37416 [Aspergillus wentii DTO 134E9]|uniref:Zn(2)-C6 fungal-type domain-containing protein n=1 Tax=Aspergillus wentii DTO 134E9 TaxID=1073089 RepID=A0A1L9RXD3_ASPWE|nr:uncharacterized protein ASPWEDRAFT_37416 [Aspergillus wentii DTO 134E9]OJJ39600.1 hypothetical protein ASPWEDRAFT_37416 [Aspergillus wentii DTO 134E9]
MQESNTPGSRASLPEVQGQGISRTRHAQLKSRGSRRHACDRCRRQKLKCDVEKPCSLCIRSGFLCETTSAPLRKSKRSAKSMDRRRSSVQRMLSDIPASSRSSPRTLDTPRGSLNRARTDIPSDTGKQPEPP